MDEKYWLGFSLIPEMGAKRIHHLAQSFTSLETAWHATERQLLQTGLPESVVQLILTHKPNIDLDHELARVHKVDAFLLPPTQAAYPTLLQEAEDAPPLLYVRGNLAPEADKLALCIVGTRRATVYGKDAAYQIARELAEYGVTIVSGLADGIDTAAHRGALDGGGRTLAVMATGINSVYPSENRALAREIIQQGAVFTELPINTPPSSRNFPRRNRLLSGLTLGVLVVEAGDKSGALITANIAAEQGRDVFAVPSNIFNPEGRGANRLIQEGAKLVMSAQDILEELNTSQEVQQTRTHTEQIAPANETETRIIELLSHDPLHINELVRRSGLDITQITSTLTILELKGLARNVGNMQYTLSR